MIKSLVATLALSALTLSASAAPPRVATVKVNDILLKLDATAKANEDYKAKRDAIAKDKRKVALDEMLAELELRRAKLSDPNAKIDEETRKKLLREYMLKQQEMKSLQDEYQNFSAEKHQALNTEMVASIRERLTLIHGTAEKIAKEEGFDWVFDSSGISNTGVPLMLYAKHPNDLTERVIAALGAVAKPAEPPKPPEKNDKNDKKPKQR